MPSLARNSASPGEFPTVTSGSPPESNHSAASLRNELVIAPFFYDQISHSGQKATSISFYFTEISTINLQSFLVCRKSLNTQRMRHHYGRCQRKVGPKLLALIPKIFHPTVQKNVHHLLWSPHPLVVAPLRSKSNSMVIREGNF